MVDTLGTSSHMAEGVISPAPELEPNALHRLRCKRPLFPPDGDDSEMELTDSSDSQGSAPYKRAKIDAHSLSEQKAESSSSTTMRSEALSLPVTEPTQGRRASSPRVPLSPSSIPTVQEPLAQSASIGGGPIQSAPLTEFDWLSYLEATPPPEFVVRESSPLGGPHDVLVQRVCEVVPDVLPAHVFKLLYEHEAAASSGNLLEVIVHALLEGPYPKDFKGKGKASAAKEDTIDYTKLDVNRIQGPVYQGLCLNYLRSNFPAIEHTNLTGVLSSHKGCYAPTYLHLLRQGINPASAVPLSPQLERKKRKRKSGTGTGNLKRKRKDKASEQGFMKEHTWLVNYIETHDGLTASGGETDLTSQVEGDEIECGCCFSNYPFSKMAQCADTHLFCESCVTSYVSTQVGEQNSDLHCIDLSGCPMTFPDSELRRVLPERLFNLFELIRFRRDIKQADLEGLEECPFCDFRVVMDADSEADKVLRCQNEECWKESCRKCKKENHIPKSCEEAYADEKAREGKHVKEEAKSRALIHHCPQCQKASVKEYGCDSVYCPSCKTHWCYKTGRKY